MTISYYDGIPYQKRSEVSQLEGFILASLASGAIMNGTRWAGDSFQRELVKQQEHNSTYREYLNKAFELSNLKEKGVEIVPAQKFPFAHPEEAAGRNACYIPGVKKVILNTDKISHAGYHELGHALNDLMSKYGVKYLQKLRVPAYAIVGIMEYFSVFSRTKPKDAKKSVFDRIEDNCGKIAFLALMPVVAEEAIASYRGVNLAKKAGLEDALVKNLKKLYRKALTTYAGYAVLISLAIGASRWIMDKFTRPKKIEEEPILLV